MTRVHLHQWSDWVMHGLVRDYTGRIIPDGHWAVLHGGGRPTSPGWSRTCRVCGQRETT